MNSLAKGDNKEEVYENATYLMKDGRRESVSKGDGKATIDVYENVSFVRKDEKELSSEYENTSSLRKDVKTKAEPVYENVASLLIEEKKDRHRSQLAHSPTPEISEQVRKPARKVDSTYEYSHMVHNTRQSSDTTALPVPSRASKPKLPDDDSDGNYGVMSHGPPNPVVIAGTPNAYNTLDSKRKPSLKKGLAGFD